MWESKLKAGMHIEHKAGDILYVDLTGKKMHYVDRENGEIKNAEIFITIMGASKLIYGEVVKSQQLEEWICANENVWRFYGGATKGICPDNLNLLLQRHVIMSLFLMKPIMTLPSITKQ